MEFKPLPFCSTLDEYQRQSEELLGAYRSGDSAALTFIREHHPMFLGPEIPWLPRDVPESEVRSAGLGLEDARLATARGYDFQDWAALAEYVEAVTKENSAVRRFESAVEAVINGDVDTLRFLLHDDPGLIRARSTRVTHFDPPAHRATLLHYVAANGVESHRQNTPKNAVEVARLLLDAGAEVDSLADLYGGQCTTISLLVSSCHPANAGVQVALTELLLDFGASLEDRGAGQWTSPLMTALVFGYRNVAEALAKRGARVDNIAAAAALGRLEDVRRLLPSSDDESRHRALALAAQHGHAGIVELFLEAGEDPNRYNPKGHHAHSTPLHQAVCAGHDAVVRLLVERGARLDMKDTIYKSTPLGWATYCGQTTIADYLRARETGS